VPTLGSMDEVPQKFKFLKNLKALQHILLKEH